MKILLLFPILVLVRPVTSCGGQSRQLKAFFGNLISDELNIRDVSASDKSSSISVSGRGRIRGLHRMKVKQTSKYTRDEVNFSIEFKRIDCEYDSYKLTIGPSSTEKYEDSWHSKSKGAESFLRLYFKDDIITDLSFKFFAVYTFGDALRGQNLQDGELLTKFKSALDEEVTWAIRKELRRVLSGKSIELIP